PRRRNREAETVPGSAGGAGEAADEVQARRAFQRRPGHAGDGEAISQHPVRPRDLGGGSGLVQTACRHLYQGSRTARTADGSNPVRRQPRLRLHRREIGRHAHRFHRPPLAPFRRDAAPAGYPGADHAAPRGPDCLAVIFSSWPAQGHRCPARFLLCKAHGIDSNGVQSFATQLDIKRISAVPHTNTVFRDILKLVPWSEFDKLVKNHGSDELVRSFTTKRQFLALLFGQLSGACSLRDIEASMRSHQGRLYHAGGFAPARSTFADANRSRNPEVFSALFMYMLATTKRGLRRKLGDAVRLIDSTSLHLAGAGTNWAR